MPNIKRVETVDISSLKNGDVVLIDGVEHTLGTIQRDTSAVGGMRFAAFSETVGRWIDLETQRVVDWNL